MREYIADIYISTPEDKSLMTKMLAYIGVISILQGSSNVNSYLLRIQGKKNFYTALIWVDNIIIMDG